jgi:hypothetical protein
MLTLTFSLRLLSGCCRQTGAHLCLEKSCPLFNPGLLRKDFQFESTYLVADAGRQTDFGPQGSMAKSTKDSGRW